MRAKEAAEKICIEMGVVITDSSFMYINSDDLKIKKEDVKLDVELDPFQFCEPPIDEESVHLTSNDPLEDTTTFCASPTTFVLDDDNIASSSSIPYNPLEGTSTMDTSDLEDQHQNDVNVLKQYCGFFVQRLTQVPGNLYFISFYTLILN